MSKSPGHRIATRKTCDALRVVLPTGWYADEQAPVTTAGQRTGTRYLYHALLPQGLCRSASCPADVALAIKVADSSLRRDRGTKKRIYARAQIATYWLLDLNARTPEVYSEPRNDDYST